MPVIQVDRYTAEQIQATRATHVYVFGDNMVRDGYGGQAGAARNQPNVVGIPTLHAPGVPFSDADLDDPLVKVRIDASFNELHQLLLAGKTVVLPRDGVGTGIADLARKAPRIRRYIDDLWNAFSD